MISKKLDDYLEDIAVCIYEGLYKKIKEDNQPEDISIEDLNMKIDIIMDALGLEQKDDNDDNDDNDENISAENNYDDLFSADMNNSRENEDEEDTESSVDIEEEETSEEEV